MINKAERKVLIFEDSTEENKSEVIENIFRIDKNEKILCIGDVQSGKTSKMIQIIKASINKGYKATIIFGGSTKILIEQTTKRLKKEFQNNRNFYIYQIINEESSDEIHGDLRGKDTHLIFVLIKSKNVDENLKKLLNIFRNHFTLQKGIIFMDDECDSYSLLFKNETKLESEENLNEKTIASKINNFFNALKENPDVRTKYLSITATPFDNIQFNQENKYDRSVIFKTDKQYTGNEYFLEKKNFYLAINSSYKNPDS
jgi:GTPase SAR1 family protein